MRVREESSNERHASPGVQRDERRQVTVLFCDLVDSMKLSEELDPEEWIDIVREYQALCVDSVTTFAGYVAQYLGDGVLVYFGYPIAHEDEPMRAAHAALAILAGVSKLNTRIKTPELSVRIGMHTSAVVAGAMGAGARRVNLVMGQAPNLAARIQAKAKPNTVMMSQTTALLLRGQFEVTDFGVHEIKGVSAKERLFRLDAARINSTRFEGHCQSGAAPLVGRAAEAQKLAAGLWSAAKKGSASLLLRGEAGIGKSRLIHHLLTEQERKPALEAVAFECSMYHQNTQLQPVRQELVARMGINPADASLPELQKITSFCESHKLDETAPRLLSDLLGLDEGSTFAPLGFTPERQRLATLELLTQLYQRAPNASARVVVFEDLHWADPSTLDLVDRLAAGAPGVLLLLSARPEWMHSFPAGASVELLQLSRVSTDEVAELARFVAGGRPLPAPVLERIREVTDGIPLYIEEFTKSLLESGALTEVDGRLELTTELDAELIPMSLRDLLSARLDRLGFFKLVAEEASVIGRSFSYELLAAVSAHQEEELRDALLALVGTGLVRDEGAGSYQFRHALLQAAAYDSMPRKTRQGLHASVSAVLTSQPATVSQQPGLIGYHFQHAGESAQACNYYLLAGKLSLSRSANQEAIGHLRAGLNLIPDLDQTARDATELALLSLLGPALIATTGFGSEAVGTAYTRAQELCAGLDGRPESFGALWGSWVYRLVRGELEASCASARKMCEIADQTGISLLQIEAHWTLGTSHYWMGQLDESLAELTQAAELYEPEQHRGNALIFGQDPGATAQCYLVYTLLHLGRLDEAKAALETAHEIAYADGHQFTIGWALAFRFMFHMYRDEPELAGAAAEKSIEHATVQSHPFWLAAANIVLGWSQARKGDPSNGIQTIEGGLAFYEATGSGVVQPVWFRLLAEVQLAEGHLEAAEQAARRGLEHVEKNKEQVSASDLWRVRGEIERAQGHKGFIDSWKNAVAAADGIGSKLSRLRVALSHHEALVSLGRPAAEAGLKQAVASFDGAGELPALTLARAILARKE